MKQELRKEMRKKIREFLWSRDGLYLPVGIDPVYLPVGIQTIFAYLSTPNEIDTSALIRYAFAKNHKIAVPRIDGNTLVFHSIESADGPFATGPYGLREPHPLVPRMFPSPETGFEPVFPLLVLVPGLAFSRDGHRLGKGGGFYDRFLSALLAAFPGKRDHIILAGTAWSFQIVKTVPVEKHDISVDCLYTENGCILC